MGREGEMINGTKSHLIDESHMVTPDLFQNGRITLPLFHQLARHFLDDISVAVYVCENPDGMITYYNQHAAKLWGCRPVLPDPSLRFCGSLRMIRLDGTVLPHSECPMAEVLRTGIPVRDQEVIVECPDGTRHTVLVNIIPALAEDKTLLGAINIFFDITERKQAQEALWAANALLEQRVRERTSELSEAYAQLEEKVQDLELFHDMVVNRELKMIELENEMAKLQEENEALKKTRPVGPL
jgi:hypothetical protein